MGDWGYDSLALEEATSGHALSVLGFMLVTRTEVFKKFRLDKGRLARCVRAAGDAVCVCVCAWTACVGTAVRQHPPIISCACFEVVCR